MGQVDVKMNQVDLPQGKYQAQQFDEKGLVSRLSEQKLLLVMDRLNHPQVRKRPGMM